MVLTVFQGVTALTAVAAVLFTARSLGYTADATTATRDQLRLTERAQISDRFGRAIDQLGQEGPDKLSIRLGGIYALEHIMRDSAADKPTVIEVLCAFIRTHAPRPNPIPEEVPPSSPDVQAAIVVLGRRPDPDSAGIDRLELAGTLLSLPDADLGGARLVLADLSFANLAGADLSGADLSGADLSGANLNDAYLGGAYLAGADLNGANLGNADLDTANLAGANLNGANLFVANLDTANLNSANLGGADLAVANLNGANLNSANLGGADLVDANLVDANLGRANLNGADLTGADLTGADLSGADLSFANGLAIAQLAGTRMDTLTRLPPGVAVPSPRPTR
ncbi:pentapeptide repeat-containing protein [Phytohabitans aurantiacus]|uniref:pentapeptide repeat-containing protein n=1 Tax=Phytohabitans aurantiacus TaxID=3016789 RepID=UPI002492E37D|nr:pentapeptide repeat-containing protein [Phytohabitans aurantiacus]